MAFNVRQVPIIGGHVAKIGQVWNTLASPCDPDPWVAFQAAFAATPYLLLALTKPELVDFDTVRRGRRHKKTRRFRFRFTQILQPTIVIGTNNKWVRFALGPVERIGWYMLVADATTDFLVNWTSMAYRWSGCKVPGQPRAFGVNNFSVLEQNVWNPIQISPVYAVGNSIFMNTFGVLVKSGTTASQMVTCKPGVSPEDPEAYITDSIACRIINSDTNKVMAEMESDTPRGTNKGGGVVFKDWNPGSGDGAFRLEVMPMGPTPFGLVVDLRWDVFGQELQGLEPDP